MAYMTKDGKGPYPCYAGEYCGNHHPDHMVYAQEGQTHEEAQAQAELSLAKMRFGRPHACKAGTSDEMAARGWIGLYLKQDDKVRLPGEVEVATPDELREPAAAVKGD